MHLHHADEAQKAETAVHGRPWLLIDLFTDTAAILISIVSNSHYGMPKGQIHINLPPGHPIMSFETIEIKMVAVSVKRSIGREKWLCACVMCWPTPGITPGTHRVVS